MEALRKSLHAGGIVVLQVCEDVSKREKVLVAPKQQLP
jgi:hypothetical protein